MTEISVFNKQGQVDYILTLSDDVQLVSGRTSRSSDLYYKGVGSYYTGHTSPSVGTYVDHGPASVFYYGRNLVNQNWLGKFGIFQDKFQPYFSDFVGTCGRKELNIIFNSRRFELSAVEVVDVVEHDPSNQQFYFKLKYNSDRSKYAGDTAALTKLLICMVQEGWNFPWDKTSINDVNSSGLVTDVADVFQSNDIIHSFGTVYSILYSLRQTDEVNYNNFLASLNCSKNDVSDIPFIVLLFLRNCGKDVYIKQNVRSINQLYTHLVGNVLMRGRNCAGVEDSSKADAVMIGYLDRFKADLTDIDSSVIEIY